MAVYNPSGYHDLSIAVENDPTFGPVKQAEMTNLLIRLGFETVAYNVSVTAPLRPADSCKLQLCAPENPEAHKRDPAALRITGWGDESAASRRGGRMRQYTRITITMEDSVFVTAASESAAVSYDIVAARPANDKVFELCCKTAPIDLVSLDLSMRLPFALKPPLVKAAIDRGVFFEICYTGCLKDSGTRRQFISNCHQLCRAAKGGKGIVVSSDASRTMELRSPYDVANLSSVLGIAQAESHNVMRSNAAAVVRHAEMRKKSRGGGGVVTMTVAVTKANPSVVPSDVGGGGLGGGDDDDGFMAMESESEEEEDGEDEGGDEGGEGDEVVGVGGKRKAPTE